MKKTKKIYLDYYYPRKMAILFSIDWKREFIYYIPDSDKPIVKKLDFNGKNEESLEIDMDYKKFKVDREELKALCDFSVSYPEPIFKIVKPVCFYPSHAPPLQGLKVIKDWLLIITGKRNWTKGENEALVYKLPQMEYEGSLYMPFPNYSNAKWIDNYYITTDIIKNDDDYNILLRIYKIVSQ